MQNVAFLKDIVLSIMLLVTYLELSCCLQTFYVQNNKWFFVH